MHNFIESPICMGNERLTDPKHPAQKPVSILKKMIQIASNPGDIIFDPFMGVGSTGVAALEMDRRFIGVELEEDYFKAAEKRLDNVMKEHDSILGELFESPARPVVEQTLFDSEDFTDEETPKEVKTATVPDDSLAPIIKWAGGKEKELKYIIPNAPEYKNFYEPFVGGGSVFAAVRAEHYYINDFSAELISLYRNIAGGNKRFYKFADLIDRSWENAHTFFSRNKSLKDLFLSYRNGDISKDELKTAVELFCKEKAGEIAGIMEDGLDYDKKVLLSEMKKNLTRKLTRMRDLEVQKHQLPDKDLNDNIETAIKSAVYMTFRAKYNELARSKEDAEYYCALFLYIRNYSYSGMFRYNDAGDFNVPYGGIAYNNKGMRKKIDYYRSQPLARKFAGTSIYNLDFEAFLEQTKPTENDFVFLDPPYDSEFSTYAKNEFTKADQERLAHYMINKCKARWMMIIKNTDFIYSLYDKPGVYIKTFDKEYLVSFMNRNDKKVTHLLITNYEL